MSLPAHGRTASENAVQTVFPAQRPLLRTVRSTNFRSATSSAARPAGRALSRERPTQPGIEPVKYDYSRPRSAASSHRYEGTSTVRRVDKSEALDTAVNPPPVPSKIEPLLVSASAPAAEPIMAVQSNPLVRRERQYPFATSGFVPKSRRERDAEAAEVPLPPSPTLSRQVPLEVPPPLSLNEVTEPAAIKKEPTPPPPLSAGLTDEAMPNRVPSAASSASGAERRKAVPLLANKIQPSFRPRRGGEATTPSSTTTQPRKVSAFGAPAIITTTVKVPPVPPIPATNTKPTKPAVQASASQSRPPAASSSSRSISGHNSSSTISSRPLPASVSASNVPVTLKAVPSSKTRVVSTPGSSTSSRNVGGEKTGGADAAAVAPPKREPRARNATGMTTSQMLKQKPPVQRTGSGASSKLRGAKSVMNLASATKNGTAPPVPKLPVNSQAKGTQKAQPVAAEVAAYVPLPPSPKLEANKLLPADIPLPTSPLLEAAELCGTVSVAEERLRNRPLEPAFPTIESIKERLSDVLGTSDAVTEGNGAAFAEPTIPEGSDAPEIGFAVPVTPQDEPEFTLSDLEIPPPVSTETADLVSVAPIAADAPEVFEAADFEAVDALEEPATVFVHSSSPVLSLDKDADGEKVHRSELEGRVVLGDVETNVAL